MGKITEFLYNYNLISYELLVLVITKDAVDDEIIKATNCLIIA